MKKKIYISLLVAALLWLFIAPDLLEARGSFGGFRGGGRSFGRSMGRSFGGSRSRTFSTPRSGSRSIFGSRNATRSMSSAQRKTSFGGNRMSSSAAYTSKYGAPRKVIPAGTRAGIPRNYVVNDYGGYGSGLMMGYMMGHSSWMWAMPFHPAFYYSRPSYVQNSDGTVSVYPPTFSFGRVFFTILIVGAIVYIIYVVVRNRKNRYSGYTQSSFT